MPKKYMPPEIRARELQKLSSTFSSSGFHNTAKWIKQLSKTVRLPNVTLDELLEDLKDIQLAFKNEFVGNNYNSTYRETCFNAFENLVLSVIYEKGPLVFSKTFEKVMPSLKLGEQALQNTAEIYLALVASPKLNDKQRFYGFCFMYQILVEGVFDEDIRILYALKKAHEGIDVDYEEIKEEKLWFFKSKLDPIFFEGYNNHIRNAIAHARFRYDPKNEVMIFKDISNKGKKEFKKKLSLKEFGTQYYDKIQSFCSLNSHYLVFLGILDLATKPKPFGRIK